MGVTKRLNKRHLVIAAKSVVRIARAFCLTGVTLLFPYTTKEKMQAGNTTFPASRSTGSTAAERPV